MYLGSDVNEYIACAQAIISKKIEDGDIRCDLCTKAIGRHSSYERGIKELHRKIEVTIVRCADCKKGHALLPDFILQYKQYSANEIEGVIIDSDLQRISEIDTEASESTVRRWKAGVGEKIRRAVGILKYLFMQMLKAASEILIEPGSGYAELTQVLEKAPAKAKNCGNKLGLANIWLGMHSRKVYI
jgi:hypothetical protein